MTGNTKTFTDDELRLKVATAMAKAHKMTEVELKGHPKIAAVVMDLLANFTLRVLKCLAFELELDHDRLIDEDFMQAAESLK